MGSTTMTASIACDVHGAEQRLAAMPSLRLLVDPEQ